MPVSLADYVENEAGCHVWQRARTKKGYGCITIGGTMQYAHRAAYRAAYGEIPDGLCIDHLCRNPACINPEHLEAVTMRVNCRRGAATKLTDADVATILASGESNGALALRYGVTHKYVCKLRNGWATRTAALRA